MDVLTWAGGKRQKAKGKSQESKVFPHYLLPKKTSYFLVVLLGITNTEINYTVTKSLNVISAALTLLITAKVALLLVKS
jgi:hypothetical protein